MLPSRKAPVLLLGLVLVLVLVACAAPIPAPNARAPGARAIVDGGALPSAAFGETAAVADAAPKPVDPSLVTHGSRAMVFAKQAVPPAVPVCAKGGGEPLAFENRPIYSDKIEKGKPFTARLFVGNPAACSRKVAVSLSFTPPKTTMTRTVDFAAYVPPRGAFVELRLDASEIDELNVTPGRYALTFAVFDEERRAVGRALAGNPFRLGRDDVAIASAPAIPARIGVSEDLVVPFAIQNVGDTANRVTPLIVFTRPGETAGIEHYDPPQLVLPGASTYTLRLSPEARAAENIGTGSWLVTVTMFDAAGDRLNSFAGLPLTIGVIDLRMARPELPTRVSMGAPLRAVFKLENRGDTPDRVTAVIAFTKPGTTTSREFTFTREVPPGPLVFEAVIEPALRAEKGVDKGVWLVTTAAFRSSGERIKSFTGHYLELVP